MKLKPVFWPVIVVVLLITSGLLILELRPTTVTVSMLWECGLPEHFDLSEFVRSNPSAKPVTLHFVRYPNVVDIESQPGLCDALKASGKREVQAVILLIGNPSDKNAGYEMEFVNGYNVRGPYAGGMGNLGGYSPRLDELLR